MANRLIASKRRIYQQLDNFDIIGERRNQLRAAGRDYTIVSKNGCETLTEAPHDGIARKTQSHVDGYNNANASNLSALPKPVRDERICMMAADDIPVKVIAPEAGLTQQRIYQILRENR